MVIRICLDFTANKFYVILFSLFEALFTIFTLFVLANRPLFAATKQCKSAQKHLSTKLEIKSKQILILGTNIDVVQTSHYNYPLPLRGLPLKEGECFLVCSYAHHFLFSILSSLFPTHSLHRPCLRTCLPSAA